MTTAWSIKADWALLESGSPEERAAFAALGIIADGTCLTAGHDRLLNSLRDAPYLSAFHLAEWLAWNWWRLRWEPEKSGIEWQLSHAMASIGNGYIWPNIDILSDGCNITLISRPTAERKRTPYRYINEAKSTISAAEFESEVDLFIETVLRRLEDCRVAGSNLSGLWQSVLEERNDATLSQLRKLEALLGEYPGELSEASLHQLLDSAAVAGPAAVEEIAANRTPGQGIPDIAGLIKLVRGAGAGSRLEDRTDFKPARLMNTPTTPAWRRGETAAKMLRTHLGLAPDQAIANRYLSELYGAQEELLTAPDAAPAIDLSLSFAESGEQGRVLLRSRHGAGRRFDLARLLGDHIVDASPDPMSPATRSYTYRQKLQRAFAAEFLSPFSAVDQMLNGDYSMESQQEVAHHFNVSELTIRTSLANHHRISRSELGEVY